VTAPTAAGDGLELEPSTRHDEGHRAELTVAAGSPWFDGHFPGHPVLPAIAHLAIAARLHRQCGEPGTLSGVEALRFAEPVRPGDRLVAHLASCDEQARARFRLERAGDGVEVSSGSLVWGSPSADDVPDAPEIGDDAAATAPELPHAGPSRLLESVAVLGAGQVMGHGRVPATHAAARGGRAPAFLAVELAAQTAAHVPQARDGEDGGADSDAVPDGEAADGGTASEAATPGGAAPRVAPPTAPDAAPATDEPRLGYLVRLREVRFARAEIDVEASLVAHVDLAGRTGPLARFDFVVVLPGGEPIAAGSFATWDLATKPPAVNPG
jgi:3-hydroxymyristoyl/3-hydroxydecanoyl-(acyl carrier protein) dehydratase